MNARLVLALYLVLSVVQLATPIGQIWKHEDLLQTGRTYKFRTAPVDPYDAFRGKYVSLAYANTTASIKTGDRVRPRDIAYVILSQDENGFALFGEISDDPPISGDYLRVECQYMIGSDRAAFRLPFDRFFMEESKAPLAEQAYRRFGNRRNQVVAQAYALVRVKNGRGAIVDLFINDQPIQEFIKKQVP